MKKILIIFLVLGVVFISGCTTQSTGSSSNDGIVITSFIADPPTTQGGDQERVYLLMDIQNTGGEIARIQEAKIIGLPTAGNTGWKGSLTPIQTPGELYPPEKGIEGEIATLEWELTPPASQTDIDYPAEGVIKYDYGTHIETLVRLANKDWLRSLPYDERQTESEKQGTISGGIQNGPIHATIKPTSSTGSRLIIDIQNAGSGFAENDQVSVSVTGMTCDSLSNPVTLIRGKSKQFRCDTIEPTQQEQWKNVRIDVDLSYVYVVKRPVTITVEGTPV